MATIEAALDSMLDFSGPTIDSNIIEKFVCRITPVDNGHYRWDLNFAPNKKQAIIGAIEGRKGKASVEIKEYGEDDEHPHRTYDKSIQFSADGTNAYFLFKGGLCGGQTGDRDAERRAGHVVQADVVAELDGRRVAAVLAADAAA